MKQSSGIENYSFQECFDANIVHLDKYSPSMARSIVDLSHSERSLIVDDRGYMNVLNGDKLYYNQSPKTIAKRQVEHFKNGPEALAHWRPVIHTTNNLVPGPYEKALDAIDASYNEWSLPGDSKDQLNFDGKTIPLLLVFGIGVGLHIKEMVETFNICQLILIDSDPIMLKLSMHCFSWNGIFDYFNQEGRRLDTVFGGNPESLGEQIVNTIRLGSVVCCASPFAFYHDDSALYQQSAQHVSDNYFRAVDGWGEFEDEWDAYQQTIVNLGKQFAILGRHCKLDANAQVVLVGNGPSLDRSLNKLAEISTKSLIFSCGTSLKPLLHNDIIPDVHVELERKKLVASLIKSAGDSVELSKIRLLAPTRVHPDVLRLFKHNYLWVKGGDSGGALLTGEFPDVSLCNPTVANAALALCIRLGFKNIVLMGIDLGWIDNQKHHASNSVYFDSGLVKQLKKSRVERLIQSRDGVAFASTHILDWSRVCMEELIRLNEDCVIHNCSDGVDIKGTIRLPIDELTFAEGPVNQWLGQIESSFSANYPKSLRDKINAGIDLDVIDSIFTLCKELMFSFATVDDVYLKFSVFDRTLRLKFAKNHKVETQLVYGSLVYLQLLIVRHYFSIPSVQIRKIFLIDSQRIFIQCLDSIQMQLLSYEKDKLTLLSVD